jgi:hypothetical protein
MIETEIARKVCFNLTTIDEIKQEIQTKTRTPGINLKQRERSFAWDIVVIFYVNTTLEFIFT